MYLDINIILCGLIIVLLIIVCIIILKNQIKKQTINVDNKNREKLEIEYLVEEIKDMMFKLTTKYFDKSLKSKEGYERELNKRIELKKALKGCNSGNNEDKAYIIDFISDLLEKYYITTETVDNVLYFEKIQFLSVKDMFDIMMYTYKKEYGFDALKQLITEEKWDKARKREDEELPVFEINEQMVKEAYLNRNIKLSYEDKIKIIAQRIYEMYKGFGAIDIVRDMAIDGVSGGVSGLIDVGRLGNASKIKDLSKYPRNYQSIWIFYKGKNIYMSFLSFGSERELKRVCQSIYRYNKAGQLSENIGYKVNEMKDGSRVVVVRPPFSETWAFFVRKFHLQNIELEQLIQSENSKVMIELLKFLMKGGRITSITGSQGAGKTTMLMAMIRHIYPTLTLRVQEMAFELNLRKLYPKRNILTFRETETVSAQSGLDLQKKTDGAVNILGEVASDEVTVLMLQTAQVASLFTLFTHHAKTVADLILSLRNSLLKCNVFTDEKIAEEQVVKVLDFDIHLNKDYEGNRYIERITEIIPINQKTEYSTRYKETEDYEKAFLDTKVEYYKKRTQTKLFEEKVIIYYEDGKYILGDAISKNTVRAMLDMMTSKDKVDFKQFIDKNWEEVYDGI